jgi:hypothetical protein
LPQHRLRAVIHSIDSLRLLACLPLFGVVVQMTRHCSNLASAVHKTLCRRRLHSHSQFLDGGRLLATLSRRMPHSFQNFLVETWLPTSTATPVALSSILSCQFYRRSFATVTSLLRPHCTIPYYTLCRRSTPFCCNPTPFQLLSTRCFYFFYFFLNFL